VNQIEIFNKLFSIDLDERKINSKQNLSKLLYILDMRMYNEKTILYMACQDGNFKLVNYFLEKGLNPTIKSKVLY